MGGLPLQGAGLRRRHATASWTYLFRLIELLSSSELCCNKSSYPPLTPAKSFAVMIGRIFYEFDPNLPRAESREYSRGIVLVLVEQFLVGSGVCPTPEGWPASAPRDSATYLLRLIKQPSFSYPPHSTLATVALGFGDLGGLGSGLLLFEG